MPLDLVIGQRIVDGQALIFAIVKPQDAATFEDLAGIFISSLISWT